MNEGIFNTAANEAEDQIAEKRDRSVDQFVGLESSNWFFQIALAAEQVGAKHIPAYTQYFIQSHLDTTAVNQSGPERRQRHLESDKNGKSYQQGNYKYLEQSIQCSQREPKANDGAASGLICPNDNCNTDHPGCIPSDIVRLQQILSSKVPAKYERQEGKGTSALHGSGSIQ